MNMLRKTHPTCSCCTYQQSQYESTAESILCTCVKERIYKYNHGIGEFTLILNMNGNFHIVMRELTLQLFACKLPADAVLV